LERLGDASSRISRYLPVGLVEIRVRSDRRDAMAAISRLSAIEGKPLWVGDPHFDVAVKVQDDGHAFELRSRPRRFRTLYLPVAHGTCERDTRGICIVRLAFRVTWYESLAPLLLVALGIFFQGPRASPTSKVVSFVIAVGMHLVALYAVFRPACRRICDSVLAAVAKAGQ